MKIYNDTLNKDSVSIQSEAYGMRAYVNSTRGRAQLESEVPAELVTEIYNIWGDTPTLVEPTYPDVPINTSPTIDDRIAALEAAQLAALGV